MTELILMPISTINHGRGAWPAKTFVRLTERAPTSASVRIEVS